MTNESLPKRIHLISIGGAVMHNLAIALQNMGNDISGSDDEIYDPSRSRLIEKGLCPREMGWFPENIEPNIDLIIVGMHAHFDNPEVLRAMELDIPVMSFPEFIHDQSKDKRRVVVAGSHGKTTTTSMIMHALQHNRMTFDYLVGAHLEGFETMVQLSDAKVIIIEGDEYPSSRIDLRSKFMHYDPDIAIITGVSWDHMNIFRTEMDYIAQFESFVDSLRPGTPLIYFSSDSVLSKICESRKDLLLMPYIGLAGWESGVQFLGKTFPLHIFGDHNLQNLHSAMMAGKLLGIDETLFLQSFQYFHGPDKRLEMVAETSNQVIFLDYAHAPSKVEASCKALRKQFPSRSVHAVFELHTYSSLNRDFLPQYRGRMHVVDEAVIFYDEHTFEIKRLPKLNPSDVKEAFGRDLEVITKVDQLELWIKEHSDIPGIYVFMSSGHFGGLKIDQYFKD